MTLSLVLGCLAVAMIPEQGYLSIEAGLVATADLAHAEGFPAAPASTESMAGKRLRSLYLHPPPEGNATWRFPGIVVPAAPLRPQLHFSIGMREGIPWGQANPPPNGVRFIVAIDDEAVFQEDMAESGWRSRYVDLDAWAGQTVSVTLMTNAIDGLPNYDWSVWGDPVLTAFHAAPEGLPEAFTGVLTVHLEADAPGSLLVVEGEEHRNLGFAPGKNLLAVEVARPVRELKLAQGTGAIVSARVSAFRPSLTVREFQLSSPLLQAGHPFQALLLVRNKSRADFREEGALRLAIEPLSPGATVSIPELQTPVPPLMRGEETYVVWRGILPTAGGDVRIGLAQTDILDAIPHPIEAHIFPPPPESKADMPIISDLGWNFVGVISGAGDRLRLNFAEDLLREAFAFLEVRQGDAYRRVASLFPLAYAAVKPVGADLSQARRGRLLVERAEIRSDGVEYHGTVAGQPVRIVLTLDPESGRIHVTCTLTAAEPLDLLAFGGPSLLAGDRAFGIDKDFALFGGIEYLEGAEHSSSERDLAFPLSDRRVPAHHKIASPVMAVQAEDALIALLWDANQEWAPGRRHPAARFLAPPEASGLEHIHMSLFAPSVGAYVQENEYEARTPFPMAAGETVTLRYVLVADARDAFPAESVAHGPHRGGLLLQAYRHWFDVFGFPEPSPQPRDWEAQKSLCLKGYFDAVWSENPPGWSHCFGWAPGPFVAHSVPLLLLQRDIPDAGIRDEIRRRVDLVINRVLSEQGPGALWTNAGAHIVQAELPYYEGYLPESLRHYRDAAFSLLGQRQEGLWRWRSPGESQARLGTAGDHTLSQAAAPLSLILRAARMTGNAQLAQEGLAAMSQMKQYEVPRGAQTWECPLLQPDILAAAQAIRAYCEAYRLTGDPEHLRYARYWAWTGLPFLYLWEMENFPTMRYNVIAVMGSTFFSHSWIGLPVVWCGLVYAYALQDLAPHDDSLPWLKISQGITNSTMWQQYTEGPNAGTYPDSWDMVRNRPNPADINPENILMNELRLRGLSPDIRSRRIESGETTVMLNAAAEILRVEGQPGEGALALSLASVPGFPVYATLAPVDEPAAISGAGERSTDSAALRASIDGWLYDPELRAIVLKSAMQAGTSEIEIRWD